MNVPYPRFVHHINLPARLARSLEHHASFGPGWYPTPTEAQQAQAEALVPVVPESSATVADEPDLVTESKAPKDKKGAKDKK